MTCEELLGERGKGRKSEAVTFLLELLANGPVSAQEVKEAAEAKGLGWSTVRRAKDEADVIVEQERDGMKIGRWVWRIADAR